MPSTIVTYPQIYINYTASCSETYIGGFEDFEKYGSAEKAKENGKLRVEGKDYLVEDGDVLLFRVNP